MKKIIVLAGLIVCSNVYSNTPSSSFWQDAETLSIQQKDFANDLADRFELVKRSLILDKQSLNAFLTSKNLSARPTASDAEVSPKVIDLPLPEGGFVSVQVFESDLLSIEMQEQYPDIKAWRVKGLDESSLSGRIDITPNGFHAMLTLPNGDTVYIDPDSKNDTEFYSSFSKKHNHDHFKTDFKCKLHDDHTNSIRSFRKDISSLSQKSLAELPNPNLITYRLALASTAEYTASQGGTTSKAYASMVTTINRVNEIYQRDLGIKLQLVNGESLIYTDPKTDPYTNSSAVSLVSENISNINNRFGAENYDIGHVFAQGPLGGLAYAGSTCQEDYKAGGVTGTPTPNGETFSIEYVAHELGHQLGATHTFNSQLSSCGGGNRVQVSAVEPGSGSTIMSYSGLCGSDNIQSVSDAVFHWTSISQIANYTRNATGKSCGARATIIKNDIEVNAGSDYVIPANTPFLLQGTAKGGSTYSWDQVDTGSVSTVNEDLGDNALIRARVPKSTDSRYLPELGSLFSKSSLVGETLPKTTREMNFAFVVRDQNGSVATDYKKISVENTHETFEILSQSTEQSLSVGQTIDVEWSVANTDKAPISCERVDIQLINSNGTSELLTSQTNNDGYEPVVIPDLKGVAEPVRIMVNCSNNSFFQLSAGDIYIENSGRSNSAENNSNNSTASGGAWGLPWLYLLGLLSVFGRIFKNYSF